MLSLTLVISACVAAELRAGVAQIDVSPERFPVAVNCLFNEREVNSSTAPLHARCLVLDDGRERIGICIVDSCMMPRELIDRAKLLAAQPAGLKPERILIAATHTHSAPAAMGCLGSDPDPHYPAFLETQIARGLREAAMALVPVEIGSASVDATGLTHNRRWIYRPDRLLTDPFGQKNVRANMHPGYQNPNAISPSGPVDSGLTLLALRRQDGSPLAVLANFSMHYFGSTPVSPDYFGLFCEKLAEQIVPGDGPKPMVVMSQGTSGDLMWMDYGQPRTMQTLEGYAALVAAKGLEAYRQVTYTPDATLAMAEAKLTLRRRTPDAARLAWAEEQLKTPLKPRALTQQQIYAREAQMLAAEPQRELRLQAVRIGDLGITAIPNEVYALTGLKLKAASPLPRTCNIELANGAEGYIPPPAQHQLGGYTTWPARSAGLEVAAEERITDTLLGLLEQVSDAKRRPIVEPTSAYAKAVTALKPTRFWGLDDPRGAFDGLKVVGPASYYLDGATGPGSRCVQLVGGWLEPTGDLPAGDGSAAFWVWNALPTDARAVTATLATLGGLPLSLGGTSGSPGQLRLGEQTGATPLKLRQWHHLAVVRRSQGVTVYLDGRPEITTTIANTSTAWTFGGGADQPTLEGRLDDLAIFDRALSPADVAGLVSAVRK